MKKSREQANSPAYFLYFILLTLVVGLSIGIGRNQHSSAPVQAPTVKTEAVKPAAVVKKLDKMGMRAQINGQRYTSGIARLQEDLVLSSAAQIHAEDMKARGYYDHTTPEGVTSYTRIQNALGGDYLAGESQDNICPGNDEVWEIERIIASKEHYENILDPRYNVVGIGYAESDPGKCNGYVVIDMAQI